MERGGEWPGSGDARFTTAPMHRRTRLAVTRLVDQVGSSTAMTSALVTASTVRRRDAAAPR